MLGLRYPPFPSHTLQVTWESPLGVGRQLNGGGAQPSAGATEVGADVQGVKQGGHICPDLRENLCGGGSGGSVVWFRDMGAKTAHWEASVPIPPHGGPQDDGVITSERERWWVDIYPAGGSDGRGGVTGGGDLHLPPPEHIHTVHCNQVYYGPVSGGGEVSGVMSGQSVVGIGWLGLGRDVDGGSGGGTY